MSTTSPSGWYDVLTRASRATVLPVVQEATTPPKTRATLAEKNEELIGKVQNEIAQLLLQSATDDALSGSVEEVQRRLGKVGDEDRQGARGARQKSKRLPRRLGKKLEDPHSLKFNKITEHSL